MSALQQQAASHSSTIIELQAQLLEVTSNWQAASATAAELQQQLEEKQAELGELLVGVCVCVCVRRVCGGGGGMQQQMVASWGSS